MICGRMDRELLALTKNYHCANTRYADDMTFSKKSGAFPRSWLGATRTMAAPSSARSCEPSSRTTASGRTPRRRGCSTARGGRSSPA